MDLGLISVRYARALLKASLEVQLEDKVYREMQSLSDSYVKVPDFRFTIDNPMFSKQRKKQLFNIALGGDPCKITEVFIDLVLKEERENMMQFIASSYITLYRKNKNLIRAKLMTAMAVSPSTEQRLKQLVESKTNGIVEFETEIKPEILGGFIIEYDTYRMDVSVKSQLNSILSQLK